MALHGDLSENPLPELLSLMSGKTGILKLRNLGGLGQMDFHIDNGVICNSLQGERVLRKDVQIYDKLIAVTIMGKGSFDFVTEESGKLQHRTKLSVQHAALEIASRSDQIVGDKNLYPQPGQVFRWAGNPMNHHGRDPFLDAFLEDTGEVLSFGADAQRLAGLLQIEVIQVQGYLYCLLQLEAIIPLNRDELWARLDRSMKSKSGTPLKVVTATGQKRPATLPAVVKEKAKSDSQLLADPNQKIVPLLRKQPVNRPFPAE